MGEYTALKIIAEGNAEFYKIEHLLKPPFLDQQPLPEHSFFKCERKKWIIGAHKHRISLIDTDDPENTPFSCVLEGNQLLVITELKNYCNSIQHFLLWISPYLDLTTVKGCIRAEGWHNEIPIVVHEGSLNADCNLAKTDHDDYDFPSSKEEIKKFQPYVFIGS